MYLEVLVLKAVRFESSCMPHDTGRSEVAETAARRLRQAIEGIQ